MSVKRRPVKLPAGSKTHITDRSRKGVGTLVRTLCGLYVIREQVIRRARNASASATRAAG